MSKERIVVKIGSSSLTNQKGEIDYAKLNDHVEAIAALRKENHEVILVSSGAVAAGFKSLGYPARPVTLKGKQAAASVGQGFPFKHIWKNSKLTTLQLHKSCLPALTFRTVNDIKMRLQRYRNCLTEGFYRLSMRMIRCRSMSSPLVTTICYQVL